MTTTDILKDRHNRANASDLDGDRLHPLVPLTLISLIIPVYFSIGSTLLTPSRLLFLFVVPVLTLRLFGGHFGKVVFFDYCLLFKVFWMMVSVAIHLPSVLVSFVGSQAVVILGGYLVARCYIRTPAQFIKTTRMLGIIVLGLLVFAIPEAISGRLIIPPIIDALPGMTSHVDVDYERRFGLDRAQVVFVHPIHFGLFCSIAFTLVLVGLRNHLPAAVRLVWSGLVIGAVFCSVSSGPFLATLMQGIILLYDRIFRSVQARWRILIWGGTVGYVILDLLSNRPAYFAVLERLAFNSYTAGVRRTLLEYGVAQIGRTPIFGVGFGSWSLPEWMTGSLDNYWLQMALIYGLPALIAVGGGVVLMMILVGRRPYPLGTDLANCKMAWMTTMTSLGFTLATVAIWSEMMSAVYFIFGAGVFLMSASINEEDEAETEPEPEPDPVRSRYTRFPKGPVANTSAQASDAAPRHQTNLRYPGRPSMRPQS
ncbi:MAG: O-antigen ligase family protein [Paracoccaceae bacterium]